jgi:hypothetical protein
MSHLVPKISEGAADFWEEGFDLVEVGLVVGGGVAE